MDYNRICSKAFTNGKYAFNRKDYINARFWFKEAMESPSYRDKALYHLVLIDFKESKYADARKL